MNKRLTRLSKTVSDALRHEPWLYELEMDSEGWVKIDLLIAALYEGDAALADISADDFQKILDTSDDRRFELSDGRIRALYSHSSPDSAVKTPAEPPAVLFHGTAPETAVRILQDGLVPTSRQYVHLSADVDTASLVGHRKARNPEILAIDATGAYRAKVRFYHRNQTIWLSDAIPADFISRIA